ncbi:chromophore lyase CpcT/CpeT [Pseudanabaena sp. FACHB-1998]|uniref:chromophore lyase CpcT/CpeT n=1 Tax=Pseudanabaena sp. FACHB-1998 TaxID=2692858 RepID=UPI001680C50C|nr:chromophore lyase CpcT/CpeT [Pseudanabaena sp. FACHB-1998]MBD2176241.1 chromophore lyase CpcT/CpeT [Pseudanabaena sp. FACHB-1998]
MNISQNLLTLTSWMTGEFSNQEQSVDQPVWFVNLVWWQRPISSNLLGSPAIFAEQANALILDRPYRQRILQFVENEDKIQVKYWGFKDPSAWTGAGRDRDRLNQITINDIEPLAGCSLDVFFANGRYKAEMPKDAKCCFQYLNESRQVVLGFEVSADEFWSGDRGVDPETGTAIWGAIMDFYKFKKIKDFSQEFTAST